MSPECVFCQIVAGRAPAKTVAIWPEAIAFHPLNPVTPGHILVVPTTHIADFTENANIAADTMRFASMVAQSLSRITDWNLITSKGSAATQSIGHLHLHLVPRRAGDGLALPWTGQRAGERDLDRLREDCRLAEEALKAELERRRRIDREQWSVPCPTCSMPAGKACIDEAGELPEHMNHPSRVALYADAERS